ncbi:MAG: iron-containing alcohol dehydrogenase [Candidatus Binatia bacterium]
MSSARKALHDIAIAVTGVVSKLIPDRVPMTLLGPGSSRDLCHAVAQAGAKKILIVTDAMLVKLGIVAEVTRALESKGVAWCIYDGVEPDPTSDQVGAGLALLRRENCDAVLAVGGGSPMDAAKVIAAAATNDKPLHKLEGLMKVRRAPLPLYAIPTTAGTGSEVTIAAVVSDPVTHAKKFFVDPKLLPLMTALDPALMTGLPPAITAATGMDALTHAVESYLSKTSTAQTERWASAAIRLIFENLPKAYREGSDMEARGAMALASYYAGLAFTRTSVGYVHAIAHQLGAHYRTPHGLANATVLPHVLEFSIGPAEKRMSDMARMIGLDGPGDAARARAFLDAVRELARNVEIPPTLAALELSDIPGIARDALAEAHMNYPVPRYMEKDDCELLVRQLLARA